MRKISSIVLLPVLAAIFILSTVGCGAQTNIVNIPAGYAGMILTPTGWTNKWIEAGQVDLGVKNNDGTYNQLVLLEVTSTTVKEQFLGQGETPTDSSGQPAGTANARDDRVLTQDTVPLSVDVYIRAMAPVKPADRSAILAQVTPKHFDGDPVEVQRITVEMIYSQFAKPETRGTIRSVMASYANYAEVYKDFANIPDELGNKIAAVFVKDGVPLTMMNVSLSNVKPDEAVWSAQNKKAAAQAEADAIATVGQAYRDNPEYAQYQQWQTLLDMSKNDPNLVIIVNGSNGQPSDAMVQALLQQMMKKTAPSIASPTAPAPTPTAKP